MKIKQTPIIMSQTPKPKPPDSKIVLLPNYFDVYIAPKIDPKSTKQIIIGT